MKYILIPFIFITTVCDAQQKLVFPVPKARMQLDSGATTNGFYFYPTESHQVKAAESGRVETIAQVDSNYTVLIHGKYSIFYANLHKVYVGDGADIAAGALIGELIISRGLPEDEALIVRIMRHGKRVLDSTLFKR